MSEDVRITLKDVYESVDKLGREFAELRQEIVADRVVHDQHGRAIEDHETRIRSLERRVWSIPSFAALLGVASLVISVGRSV